MHQDDPLAAQRALLSEGAAVIFDVGANVGQSAAAYRTAFPQAAIHCFEPFASSFRELEERCRGWEGVRAHQLAVSDRSGTAVLHVNRTSTTNSLFATSAAGAGFVDPRQMESLDSTEVATTTLDDFCREHQIEHVSLLKLDIQGAEQKALRGTSGLLRSQRVDVVYTEVLFAPLYEGQADICDVLGELGAAGYQLYGLYDLNAGRNGLLAWGDALFVSPRLADRSHRGS